MRKIYLYREAGSLKSYDYFSFVLSTVLLETSILNISRLIFLTFLTGLSIPKCVSTFTRRDNCKVGDTW